MAVVGVVGRQARGYRSFGFRHFRVICFVLRTLVSGGGEVDAQVLSPRESSDRFPLIHGRELVGDVT